MAISVAASNRLSWVIEAEGRRERAVVGDFQSELPDASMGFRVFEASISRWASFDVVRNG